MSIYHGYSNTRFLKDENDFKKVLYGDLFSTTNDTTAPYIKPEKIKKIDTLILNPEKTQEHTGISNYMDICVSSDSKKV